MPTKTPRSKSPPWTEAPLWEKLLGLAGFILVCSAVIFLLYSALTNHRSPPDVQFEIAGIEAVSDRYLVFVDLKNIGDSTAAEVHIEARLSSADGNEESFAAVIDYLPGKSTQRVGLYFSTDPALGDLEFRALGYKQP